MRASSWPPERSNRHSSIFSACAEKIAKFTPSPSQVAPSGYGRPGQTFHDEAISDKTREGPSPQPSPCERKAVRGNLKMRGAAGPVRSLAHLTLPSLRDGPLPLPPEGRRGALVLAGVAGDGHLGIMGSRLINPGKRPMHRAAASSSVSIGGGH